MLLQRRKSFGGYYLVFLNYDFAQWASWTGSFAQTFAMLLFGRVYGVYCPALSQ